MNRHSSCCGTRDPFGCWMCRTLTALKLRRKRRLRMRIGGRMVDVRCGDCETYPCTCPHVEDWDAPSRWVA